MGETHVRRALSWCGYVGIRPYPAADDEETEMVCRIRAKL